MEHVFKTQLKVNGESCTYDVTFADDLYTFTPVDNPEAPSVKLKREEDTWHGVENGNETLQAEAISLLEQYLLSQH